MAADAGDAVTVHAPLRVASEAYETGYVDVGAELAALRAMLGGWGLDANATRIRMCHDNPGHVGAAVLDPDGDGPNAPFTAWCQHGWTLIAHIKNDVDGSGLPEWRDDWFTHMHGDPSAYPNTDQTTDNFDFRLFEAAVSEKTVLRFTVSDRARAPQPAPGGSHVRAGCPGHSSFSPEFDQPGEPVHVWLHPGVVGGLLRRDRVAGGVGAGQRRRAVRAAPADAHVAVQRPAGRCQVPLQRVVGR